MEPIQIYTSESTNPENGTKQYRVIYNGLPICADTTDRQHADELARATFNNCKSPAILGHWDGDTGKFTELESNRKRKEDANGGPK